MTDPGSGSSDGGLRAVILVPRREGIADRDAIWAWCRRWWEANASHLPVIEGHHNVGLFNRSAAVNAAAASAGAWDVAVIIDADIFVEPARVREAIAEAHRTGGMVLPFTLRHQLGQRATAGLLAGNQPDLARSIVKTYDDGVSSCVVVPRRLWDAVGGFDEGFRGWGFEDNAFAAACQTFGPPIARIPGDLWHLQHRTAPEGKRGTPSHVANRNRNEWYRTGMGDPLSIRFARARPSEAPEHDPGIPRILHRTVPAETTAEVEGWWAEWGRLHPDWRLLTWREPLDLDAFPDTGRWLRKATTGATRADLVRLEVLWRMGGVYVDSDVEPYRALDPLLPLDAFAAWEDPKVIPNAVLGARAGHPAIRECLDRAIRLVGRGAPVWDAGPGVTTRVLQGRDDVLLLPPGSFYPYHYRDYKRGRHRDHRADQPWAFGAHH